MVYHGTYRNGVVVLEEPADLVEGQQVRVLPEASAPQSGAPSTTQKLADAISGVIPDDPTDASRNHDHYLYGSPKRDEEE